MEEAHLSEPHKRILQKALAEDITIRVHSEQELNNALAASEILFGNATAESLSSLSENDFLSVFEGVPQTEVAKSKIESGQEIIDFSVNVAKVFSSNGEARRMIQNNGLSVNKTKVNLEKTIGVDDLIHQKYILLQKGKKNYFLVHVV
jgi:tyrosyl-tRNA synthetase